MVKISQRLSLLLILDILRLSISLDSSEYSQETNTLPHGYERYEEYLKSDHDQVQERMLGFVIDGQFNVDKNSLGVFREGFKGSTSLGASPTTVVDSCKVPTNKQVGLKDVTFLLNFQDFQRNWFELEYEDIDLEVGEVLEFELSSEDNSIIFDVGLDLVVGANNELILEYKVEATKETDNKIVDVGDVSNQALSYPWNTGNANCKLVPTCSWVNNSIEGRIQKCTQSIVCG